MIEVEVFGQSGVIQAFSVRGHAGYAEHGEDIVCAATSMLVYNAINSCERFANVLLAVKDAANDLSCQVPAHGNTEAVKLLLSSMVFGLEQLETQYPEYIRIRHIDRKGC